MTTHPASETGISQCDAILSLLSANLGGWVPLPELAAVSGSMAVHSRIADLRGRGLFIQQRQTRKGRMCHSSYRLQPATQALLF